MDYDKFMEEWDKMDPADRPVYEINFNKPSAGKRFKLENKHAENDKWLKLGEEASKVDLAPHITNMWHKSLAEDRVNSPSHYTAGSQEAIVTIEEAIEHAPTVSYGMLQAQVLKYLLRVWHKDNPLEDLKKAQWYLTRLINKMEGDQ